MAHETIDEVVARAAELEEGLREVIGACAPPVEALLMVHSDGKYISPVTVEALHLAAIALRKNISLLSPVELAS